MTIKDDLLQPFDLTSEEPLCRFKIFITERARYFFFDDHHIICDGHGKAVFVDDILKAYNGQEISPDSWFKYLQEREAAKLSPHVVRRKIWA